ncbi:DUF305 domain-containing protein [Agromyces bauzanensis]
MNLRTIALPALGLLAALVLSGCTINTTNEDAGMDGMSGMNHGSGSSQNEVSTEFNDADLAFTNEMIMHHQQAIEMADLVLDEDGVDPDVVALAENIKAAQQPEIDLMQSWLQAWGEPTMNTGDMDGMDHGGAGMMMSDDDMNALDAASGAAASSLFLEQMIVHHQGAIDMAEQEIDNGTNPDAIELAKKIVDDQTAEIQKMQEMLQGN